MSDRWTKNQRFREHKDLLQVTLGGRAWGPGMREEVPPEPELCPVSRRLWEGLRPGVGLQLCQGQTPPHGLARSQLQRHVWGS